MKKVLLAITALVGLAFYSCGDKCKDVNCGVNGSCDAITGGCNCTDGYQNTGANNTPCDVEVRAKFVNNAANYQGAENCGTAYTYTQPVTILNSGTNPRSITINNFGDYGCSTGGRISVPANVVGLDSLVIPTFTSCGYTISGNGKLTKVGTTTTIRVNYSSTYAITGGTQTDNCVATFVN